MTVELYKTRLGIERSDDIEWLRQQALYWLEVWSKHSASRTPDNYEVQGLQIVRNGSEWETEWVSFASGTRDYAIGACDHHTGRDGCARNRVAIDGELVVYPDEEIEAAETAGTADSDD